jgi:hypothetical protein
MMLVDVPVAKVAVAGDTVKGELAAACNVAEKA